MNNNHLYYRNRRQYQLDKLWARIDAIEAKRKQEEKEKKNTEPTHEWMEANIPY